VTKELGIQACLIKPVDAPTLLDQIERIRGTTYLSFAI
jgi:hypothetical protein